VADALSRIKHSLCPLLTSSVVLAWVTKVTQSYTNDPKCKELMQQLALSPDSMKHYTFSNGILRYKHKLFIGNNSDFRQKIIKYFHSSELGRHLGERATYQRIKLLFHWTGMK
jgi:hypothetical protein